MKEQGGMLVEKVELELKDWDFLNNIGACNNIYALEKRKNNHHISVIINIRSIKGNVERRS